MSALPESLAQYRELCRRLEEKFQEIRGRYPTEFACGRGCHSCCKPGLSVNPLEAEALREFFLNFPAIAEEALALEASNPHQGKRCRFLQANGDCLVYEARPLVCRSHGAPLQMRPLEEKDENLRYRDVCPLNFRITDISSLPPEQVLNLDTLNTLLGLLAKRAFPGNEGRIPLKIDALLR